MNLSMSALMQGHTEHARFFHTPDNLHPRRQGFAIIEYDPLTQTFHVLVAQHTLDFHHIDTCHAVAWMQELVCQLPVICQQ